MNAKFESMPEKGLVYWTSPRGFANEGSWRPTKDETLAKTVEAVVIGHEYTSKRIVDHGGGYVDFQVYVPSANGGGWVSLDFYWE